MKGLSVFTLKEREREQVYLLRV